MWFSDTDEHAVRKMCCPADPTQVLDLKNCWPLTCSRRGTHAMNIIHENDHDEHQANDDVSGSSPDGDGDESEVRLNPVPLHAHAGGVRHERAGARDPVHRENGDAYAALRDAATHRTP